MYSLIIIIRKLVARYGPHFRVVSTFTLKREKQNRKLEIRIIITDVNIIFEIPTLYEAVNAQFS